MPKTNKPNWFLNLVNKSILSALALISISGALIGGYNHFENTSNNNKLALAALNCPGGSQPNSTNDGCVSLIPSSYTCPSGGTLGVSPQDPTKCYTPVLGCPTTGTVSGGILSGTSCVATQTQPVQTSNFGCIDLPLYNYGGPTVFNGINYCIYQVNNSTSTNSGAVVSGNLNLSSTSLFFQEVGYGYQPGYSYLSSCTPPFDPNMFDPNMSSSVFDTNMGGNMAALNATFYTVVDVAPIGLLFGNSFVDDNNSLCGSYVVGGTPLSFYDPGDGTQAINWLTAYGLIFTKAGAYSANYSYPAVDTSTPITATPVYGTVVTNGVTFTPTAVSTFFCTSPIASGGNTTCGGQANGNPNYPTIPYSGSITITIDNSGGTVTIPLVSDGTFSTQVGVGTNTTSANLTKIATASISGTILTGGTVNIVVGPSPLSSSNITTLQSCTPTYPSPVVQGVGTVTCILKLTDTTTDYILPASPLTFKIDNSTANITCSSTSGSSCSIDNTADTLTITGIPTTGSSLGSQPLNVSSDGTTFIPFNNAAFIVTPITNTNIQSLSCTPTIVTVGGTTDCTVTLSGTTTFANLAGSIDFKIEDSGTIKTCNIPTTGNTLTCTGVNVGNIAATLTSKFKGSGETTTFGSGNNITVIPATTPVTPADIPGLTVTCPISPVNSTTTCTFTLPSNKTLPTDFKLSIGNGSINQTTGTAQSCTETTNTVTCINVPTGNSIGIIPIYGNLGTGGTSTKTATGENVTTTGINFGNISWIFNPDQGGTSPLFRSSDNTSITVNNFRTIFDSTPNSNTRYTCTLEYRNFSDRTLTGTPTWTAINTTPIAYTAGTGTTAGCTFNLTKQQRANALNHSLRLTITDTTNTTPSTTNPNTYIFHNEYIYRFQGAGVASGG